MAKRTPAFVGVELEPSAVHVASVTVNGTLAIKSAAYAPLEAGVVRDGEVTDTENLSGTLRDLWAANKDLPKRVRIGIANAKTVVRVIQLPPIADAKELAAAVRFQAQDQLPMPMDAAVLDYQALDVIDTPDGLRQRVLLVAARKDMIAKVLLSARNAGLKVEGIDLAAFGMVRALSSKADAALDEVVLYLGVGGLTNLAVAEGATCTFTRVVGGGIEAPAVELAERRGLTLEHARGWLDHVGFDEPIAEMDGDELILEDARTVLIDGVRRIAGDVRNTVDYHLAQGGQAGGATRCVLTGAGAAVPGFAGALG
nr:pilus assembly protein PilM [Solirubrobacterales bacterium]